MRTVFACIERMLCEVIEDIDKFDVVAGVCEYTEKLCAWRCGWFGGVGLGGCGGRGGVGVCGDVGAWGCGMWGGAGVYGFVCLVRGLFSGPLHSYSSTCNIDFD
jgi:hypothetical protein